MHAFVRSCPVCIAKLLLLTLCFSGKLNDDDDDDKLNSIRFSLDYVG